VTAFSAPYSRTERLLHNVAMAQLDIQRVLSGIEDRTVAKDFAALPASRPVFVTSLPRAGTTLTLELLCADPVFVTHSYRNMPFLLTPVFWDRLSRSFRRAAEARERAHGDGMTVDYDSVEAFEEVLWRQFWPERYEGARLSPWTPQSLGDTAPFRAFFDSHVRKLVGLARRRRGDDAPARYVSKNNGNIARLAVLGTLFPDATILVMFRDPVAHAGSLLRQHRNFLDLHAQDDFVRQYMESIGHYDFGRVLKPIDFGGWMDGAGAGLAPTGVDFWLEYWAAAFGQALDGAGPRTLFVSYDRLCADPARGLATIADAAGLDPSSPARAQAGRLRAGGVYAAADLGADPARLARARSVHAALLGRSIL
jgi:hypothetical protein